jgi:hypothetical protein
LEELKSAAHAIAVFRATPSQAFIAGTDPTNVVTPYALDIDQPIRGQPPMTINLPGGVVGTLRVKSAHAVPLRTGIQYVGFFRQSAGQAILIYASKLDDDQRFIVDGAVHPLSNLYP